MGRKRRLEKENIKIVLDSLEDMYPNAGPELNFTNPFELLIATILSAQCTDVRVNIVTAELFKKLPTPEASLKLSLVELSNLIKSCGLYKTKAKNIMETCKILINKYGGIVPDNLEDLVELPGVGRKTANVVLSNAFDIPAIAVDTHVLRVSNRLGVANAKTPEKTEEQLMKRIDKNRWSKAHHLFIFHGRRVCKARKPNCENCKLTEFCLHYSYNITN